LGISKEKDRKAYANVAFQKRGNWDSLELKEINCLRGGLASLTRKGKDSLSLVENAKRPRGRDQGEFISSHTRGPLEL